VISGCGTANPKILTSWQIRRCAEFWVVIFALVIDCTIVRLHSDSTKLEKEAAGELRIELSRHTHTDARESFLE
jgi:hypothetical protein